MREEFKVTFRVAVVLGISLTLFMILAWPAILAAIQIFSEGLFRWWIALSDIWAFSAAIFIIIVPVATEILDMVKQVRESRGARRVQPTTNDGTAEDGNAGKPVVTVSEQA